jgi:hypothetical protein
MEHAMSPTEPEAHRRGWQLVGLVGAHVGLGFLTVAISMVAVVDKFPFCDTPPIVVFAARAAFGAWLAAGIAVIGIWSSRRRFAWTVSLLWTAASLPTLLVLMAIEPATNCNIAF